MADYGVNIKVGVQGQNNAKQLGEQIREIVRGLEAADSAFTRFSNNLKSFDQRRAQRKINDELDKTAQKYRELGRLQRQLLANDNSAIKSAERRAKLEEFISKNISAGRIRRQSARQQFLAGDPGQYATTIGPQPDRIAQIRKIAAAEEQAARQVAGIRNQLFRDLNRTQIDLLQDKIKREMDAQREIFNNAMRLNKKAADDFDRRLAKATRDRSEATRLTGQTSPIGGAVGIPGSPAALAAVDRARRIKSAQGSALIGGAFPLLFGQGLGAALGGAAGGFGGGMVGGEFGFGLSLVGTQVGSMIDQLAQKAIDLGKALDPLTADTEAILSAVGKADTEFALFVKELEAAGRTAEALQLVTEELEKVVGEDGVEAIELFSAGIRGLQDDFTVFITQVAAVVAQAINDLTGQTRQIQEIRRVGETVQKARESDDPRIKAAIAELDAIPEFQVDKETQQKRVNTRRKIAALVEKIAADELRANRDAVNRVATEEKRLQTLVKSDNVAREARYLLAAQIQLEEAGSDLLDEKVVKARQLVIQEEYLAAYRQAEGSEQGQLLAGDQRRLALLELENQIAAAQTKETKRLASATQKTTKERNTQITQALTLEQKFAAELRQREATTELEADKARIAAQFEERMRRIEKVGDNTLTIEAERLANQIRITDEAQAEAKARLRSLQSANALKDSQARFEMQLATLQANAPGAFFGPFAGSEQTAFLGGLRMQAELKRREREIEAARQAVVSGDGSQSEVENLIKSRDQYKFYQEQVLEATVAQQQFSDALALTQPVTDSLFDSLMAIANGTKTAEQAFADFLRSIASMLMDAAAQMIATYFAIGVARAFAGMGEKGGGGGLNIEGVGQYTGNLDMGLGPNMFPSAVPKAAGGYISSPTTALVGEGGQGEYVIPENKMRESMARYSRGARGASVIPDAGASGTSGEGGGVAVAAPIDVRYTVERINSVDYVTADQFQRGLQSAADQGAKKGEQQTLKRLQLSGSTRKRIGL